MATHSCVLAWRIPWTEKPGRLQPMGSQSRTRLKRLSSRSSRCLSGTLLLFWWSSRGWHLTFGSSAFSKCSLNICKFTVHVLLKPGLENFEHYFESVCDCAVVWEFFGIPFLWDWNENWPFPILWPLLSFPNLLTYECSTLTAPSFRILNSSAGIPLTPLALFIVMLPKAHLTS